MRNVFFSVNGKDELPSADSFLDLILLAQKNMGNSSPGPHTQSIVLRTVKGNVYHCLISDALTDDYTEEKQFVNTLIANGDFEIVQMVSMWPEGCFDMPSYAFRKMLCELHTNNMNGEMILSGQDCYIKKTIAETFGHQ